MYLSNFRLLILMGFIALLSACASSVNVATQISEQNVLNPQEGVLTLRVINTSSYTLPFNQVYIAPKAVNSAEEVKPFIAYSEQRPIGDSTLFAVSLPPGEYSLSVVSSFIFRGNGYYSRAAFADPEFGVFSVEANKVTDLGTVIYYPKPEGDRYLHMLARVPYTAEGNLLARYFPQYADKAQQVLTWDEDERDDDRFLKYASIAQNPLEFSDIIAAPDGSIYFLGKLGVILRYSDQNGFETMAVESDLELNSFDKSASGARLVGGHEGALFYQAANSVAEDQWQAVTLPSSATNDGLSKLTVHHVSFYNDNQFDVVFSDATSVNIARYNVEDLSRSELLNAFTTVRGWDNQVKPAVSQKSLRESSKEKPKPSREIASVFVSEKGDKRRISISSHEKGQWDIFDAGEIAEFAYDPQTWEMRLAQENDEEMDVILNAGMIELGIKLPGFWSWDGKAKYYTRVDEDDSWQAAASRLVSCENGQKPNQKGFCVVDKKAVEPKKKSFSFISKPWFWSTTEGLAIVSFSDVSFWTGERSQETKIVLTNDGGASWQESELSLPNEYCTSIVTEVKNKILLSCDGASSDFYESQDRGQTWQHIRQQQAF